MLIVVGASDVSEWVLLLEGVVVSLTAVALSSPESERIYILFDAYEPVSVKKDTGFESS